VRIFKNAWFVRFASARNISNDALREAVLLVERGQVDADLGGGVVKQRIARIGQGKSSGYRTIILLRAGYRVFLFEEIANDDEKISE
jgi:hypothetical protein